MNEVVNSSNQVSSDFIVIFVLLLFIAFCFYMYKKTSHAKKEAKKELENNIKSKNASLAITLMHLIGLSIPEKAFTQIYSCPESYEFECNGVTFSLNKSKVTDVSLKTSAEIQKQAVSSIGGAVGGAILFGPLGAMIGGRAKTKELKTITTCLIFTYLKDNTIDYIAFNATNNFKAIKFVNEFQKNQKTNEKKKIEL